MVQLNDKGDPRPNGGGSGSGGGGNPLSKHKTKLILGAIALVVILSILWQANQ